MSALLGTAVASLRRNADRIGHFVETSPPELLSWSPAPEAWSPRDVLAHLLDEERHDFRVRLDLTLHQPEAPWPPIDPEAVIREGAHRAQTTEALLEAFRAERESSLRWLAGLDAPDWDARSSERGGKLRAGDLLASWATHDLLHSTQLVGLERAWSETRGAPYTSKYAGG